MIQRWLQLPRRVNTRQNNKVVLNFKDVDTLINWQLNPPLTSLIFGDYTKWCSSLMYYPMNILLKNAYGTTHILQVAGQTKQGDKAVTCRGDLNTLNYNGYTLGEFKVDKFTSFLDYEPYTKYQIWLPYYGYVDLKAQYIEDKYVQILLYVDFGTGKAQYIIGVNDSSVPNPTPPYLKVANHENTRIIGTYSFQLGYEIPVGQTGVSDMLRNMAVAGIGGVLQFAANNVGNDVVETTNVTEKNVRVTNRNPSTGRQNTVKKVSTTTASKTSTDYSNFRTRRNVSTAAQTATQILSNMHLTPSIERVDNALINSMTCQCAVFIVRKPIIATDIYSKEFRHLYGSPLCKITPLGNITGYTELSEIHLEGDGFAQITDREKAMLDSELSDGVLL